MRLTEAQAHKIKFSDGPWQEGQDNHATCLECQGAGDIGLILTLPWEGKGAMQRKKHDHRERHQFGMLASPSFRED